MFQFPAWLATFWRLWTASHQVRVQALHELARGQRVTAPVAQRPMWLEVYEATKDGTITPSERVSIRNAVTAALRSSGKRFWADVVDLIA